MPSLTSRLTRRAAIAPVALAVLLLACTDLPRRAQAFNFAPVVNVIAVTNSLGSYVGGSQACAEAGGYLATEPTATMHEMTIETAQNAGAGSEWYTFLGGDTMGRATAQLCPGNVIDSYYSSGQRVSCYWRWNVGRWGTFDDNTSLPYANTGVGVSFYGGNFYSSASQSDQGALSFFSSYFVTSPSTPSEGRPGTLLGNYLVAVGNETSSFWSDNRDVDGYTYAGYTYSPYYGGSKWSSTAQAATLEHFYSICHIQTPERDREELYNTSSKLQSLWWVLYFVILFVVLTVTFIVVSCCQEREDMDEPPEDAPEWARKEAEGVQKTKSFVGMRSFRKQEEDPEGRNDDDNYTAAAKDNAEDGYAMEDRQQHPNPLAASSMRGNMGGAPQQQQPPPYNQGGYGGDYYDPQQQQQQQQQSTYFDAANGYPDHEANLQQQSSMRQQYPSKHNNWV